MGSQTDWAVAACLQLTRAKMGPTRGDVLPFSMVNFSRRLEYAPMSPQVRQS